MKLPLDTSTITDYNPLLLFPKNNSALYQCEESMVEKNHNSSSNVKIKYKGVEVALGAQGGPAWILVLGVLLFSGIGVFVYVSGAYKKEHKISASMSSRLSTNSNTKKHHPLKGATVVRNRLVQKSVTISEVPCMTISFDHRNRERYCTNCSCSFEHNAGFDSWSCLSIDALKGQYIHVYTQYPTKIILISNSGRKIAPSRKKIGYVRFLLPHKGIYKAYISGKKTKGYLSVPPVDRKHRKWCKPFTPPY